MEIKDLLGIFSLDASGGKNYHLRVFSSLNVKIDCLRTCNHRWQLSPAAD